MHYGIEYELLNKLENTNRPYLTGIHLPIPTRNCT
jgi:hypothetical protein